MDYSSMVQPYLEDLLELLECARLNSSLPKEVDQDFLDSLTIKYHKRIIDGRTN